MRLGTVSDRTKCWKLKGRNYSYRTSGRKNSQWWERRVIAILLTFAAGTNHKGDAVSDFVVVYQADFQLSLLFNCRDWSQGRYGSLAAFWPWILENFVYSHTTKPPSTNLDPSHFIQPQWHPYSSIFHIPFQIARGKNSNFWRGNGHVLKREKDILVRDSYLAWT